MTDIYKSVRELRSHERGIRPDPVWVRAARSQLMMQVRNSMPTASAAEKNRKTLAAAYPSLMRIIRGPVFVVCSMIAIIAGGSIASVRAADRSLPGDPLYMVKLVAEQTQLAFTPSAPDRMLLKVEFTKRRVQDLNAVIASPASGKAARVRQATDILKQDLQTLQDQLKSVGQDPKTSRATAEAAKVVDREAVDVVKSLTQTKADLPRDIGNDIQKNVADAQAQAADLAMNALGVLVDARKNDAAKDVVSDADLSASLTEHREVAAGAAANVLELATSANPMTDQTRAVSSTTIGSSVTTPLSGTSSATGTAALAKDAQNALGEVEALLNAAKVDEAVTKLREGSTKSFQAQSQIEMIILASGISTSTMSSAAVTSTASGVGSATSSTLKE
jgi:hypothetical protein